MNEFLTIAEALASAVAALEECSESPRLDAELLLVQALDVPRSYLFAHPEDQLDPAAVDRFARMLSRRQEGVPLAYITGMKEFWSMQLMVSPATLVPRPESEVLVEQALRLLPEDGPQRILDLGTGSGAVALALARERPASQVTATDISESALAVARENARQLGVSNIDFAVGDWTQPVSHMRFDLIVSNPPYVPAADPDLERLQHEPVGALASGRDGLDAIRTIARDARSILREGRCLLLEHGDTQRAAVAGILEETGWQHIGCTADLAGLPRVSTAVLGPEQTG